MRGWNREARYTRVRVRVHDRVRDDRVGVGVDVRGTLEWKSAYSTKVPVIESGRNQKRKNSRQLEEDGAADADAGVDAGAGASAEATPFSDALEPVLEADV